jgi:hypothetical protein
MGCVFLNKNVFKPFNGTNRDEEHFNKFIPLTEQNRTSTTTTKNLTKKMMTKILLNIKKILKTLLNMHAIVVKHCVSHFKIF